MIWYGMVWYGMVWYGTAWHGMAWHGVVWYGMVWYGMVWCGVVWCGMVRYGTVGGLPCLWWCKEPIPGALAIKENGTRGTRHRFGRRRQGQGQVRQLVPQSDEHQHSIERRSNDDGFGVAINPTSRELRRDISLARVKLAV